MRRFRLTTVIVVALVLLAWSDRVRPADYPAAAPAIEAAQQLGATLARVTDAAVGDLTRQLPGLGVPAGVPGAPAGRLPFSPVLLLGGSLAFAVDALRARARRDRARRQG